MFLRALPHLITLLRVFCSPLIAWLLVTSRFRWAVAAILFAGITDFLDGYTARQVKSSGQLGVVLDPLADKVLLVTLFVVLGVLRLIPLWMLGLAIVRDLVIVIGAWLVRIFRGRRKFLPTTLGKVSTFFQIVLVFLVVCCAAFPSRILQGLALTALILSAIFTAWSGLDYVRIGIGMAREKALAAPQRA